MYKLNTENQMYQEVTPTTMETIHASASELPIKDCSVDLIVTSPPYWKKRDYGFSGQIGQENTPQEFVKNMLDCLNEWARVIKPTGSLFLNIGDSYWNRSLAGIPGRIELAALDNGWQIRNRIIWAKSTGMPDPAKNRLTNRHEYIIHLVRSQRYYYDLTGYSEIYGNGSNPGDIWNIQLKRNMGKHLAPFPEELVHRAITLSCPKGTCPICGHIPQRILEKTAELDTSRPQAKRAMEIAKEYGLTSAHISAIQATGISDAGKALQVQSGSNKNSTEVQRLALEAKAVLGGYFREFTFAKKKTVGWTRCSCNVSLQPAVVLDPFMGTGTTLRVAKQLHRSSIGVDLAPKTEDYVWGVHFMK